MKITKKFKKIVALALVVITFLTGSTETTLAAVDVTASTYGFNIDSSYYKTVWYTSVNTMNVWCNSVLIGQAYQNVGVAKRKANEKNQTVIVRFMMCPEDTKANGTWYHGINKNGVISMTLGSNQKYVDNAPNSSPVTYNESCSFSLGGTVNSKGEFSGNAGIGATTSWANNCFDIISKVTSGQKKITTSYNYTPTWNISDTAARKKVNRWLNSTHKEYAMIQYNNNSTSIPTFNITFTATMWYSKSSSQSWNGSTWNVWPLDKSNTKTITYK